MATNTDKKYVKRIQLPGRLRYHTLTAQEAFDSAHRANSKLKPNQRPATVEKAAASFDLLLSQGGLDLLVNYVLTEVLPLSIETGDLDEAQAKLIEDQLKKDPTEVNSGFHSAIKALDQKNIDMLANESSKYVAMVKIKQFNGQDISVLATVSEDDQLKTMNWDGVQTLFPISDTTFELKNGYVVKADALSGWAGDGGNGPVLNFKSPAIILVKEAGLFGGGSVDEDDVKAADDLVDDLA